MLSKAVSGKKHSSFLFYIIFLSVFCIAAVNLISMQVSISQKRTEYESLNTMLNKVIAENEQLKHYSADEYKNEYIEQIARNQLDYSYPDETVFYFIPE